MGGAIGSTEGGTIPQTVGGQIGGRSIEFSQIGCMLPSMQRHTHSACTATEKRNIPAPKAAIGLVTIIVGPRGFSPFLDQYTSLLCAPGDLLPLMRKIFLMANVVHVERPEAITTQSDRIVIAFNRSTTHLDATICRGNQIAYDHDRWPLQQAIDLAQEDAALSNIATIYVVGAPTPGGKTPTEV